MSIRLFYLNIIILIMLNYSIQFLKRELQIYNLTSDVTVTSFQIGSTPNLDTTSARYSGRCVQSFTSLSLRVPTISSQQ